MSLPERFIVAFQVRSSGKTALSAYTAPQKSQQLCKKTFTSEALHRVPHRIFVHNNTTLHYETWPFSLHTAIVLPAPAALSCLFLPLPDLSRAARAPWRRESRVKRGRAHIPGQQPSRGDERSDPAPEAARSKPTFHPAGAARQEDERGSAYHDVGPNAIFFKC